MELTDPSYAYNFKFTYGDGDYYTGLAYAKWDYGYQTGYKKNIVDEHGRTGTYEITSLAYGVPNNTLDGRVYVTNYYDSQSKRFYDTVSGKAAGIGHLGSETGYIIMNNIYDFRFGKYGTKFFEADGGDKFTFKCTYGNGDYYTGYVYGDPELSGYFWGYKKTFTDENGLAGNYYISKVEYEGDAGKYNKVFVTAYKDIETGNAYRPLNFTAAAGLKKLGSELGYVIKTDDAYKFGRAFYEADVACSRYTFKYTYNNGTNSDWYSGFLYAAPGTYTLKQKWNVANETKNTGFYEITGMQYSTIASTAYGQVFVQKYFDGDMSNKEYVPLLTSGATGLGSEKGYIVKTGISDYLFGKGYTEADVADKYYFKYTYNNGLTPDYYLGYVFADPTYGYYLGWKKVLKNETGNEGFYSIYKTEYTGTGSTLKGRVYVTDYYDGDATKKIYKPVTTGMLTNQYLGNEYSFIIATGVLDYQFGGGLLEADGL